MLEYMKSLSLVSTALMVAILVPVVSLLWSYMRKSSFSLVAATAISVVLSCLLYWFPVILGADSSEYWSWAPLVIGVCSAAGIISSLMIVFILRLRKKANRY